VFYQIKKGEKNAKPILYRISKFVQLKDYKEEDVVDGERGGNCR
jgi:hypothetical protein